MPRAIGGWLSGPPVPEGTVPGVRLGLPASGPGSVASTGARVGAFVIDAIIANLLVGIPYLFGVRFDPTQRGYAILLVYLLVELIFDTIYGQSFGKRLFNIRVIRVDGNGLVAFPWLVLRTVLLGLLVPAVVWDRDRRGLHDKAAGAVVVVDPNKAATAPKAAPKRTAAPAVSVTKAAGPARQPKRTPAGKPRSKRRR